MYDFRATSGSASPGVPYMALDLPDYFVTRAELNAVKRLLLERPAALLAPITLHGPAGSGKTTLAAALAHDRDILQTFPDGVLWGTLTGDDDVQHIQAVWGSQLGDDLAGVADTASRSAALRTMLRDSRTLLVIDNVTDVEQIKALNVGGPNCARIITTGAGDAVLFSFKTRRYAVGKLSEQESLNLLSEWAGILPSIYLPAVKEIIRRLSNMALSLALVGAQARQGITWLRLSDMLQEEQGPLAALDTDSDEVRDKALRLIINLVLSRFGGAQLQRAALLSAFEPGTGAPFSAEAAAVCWEMPVDEAIETLQTLVEAALVQPLPGGTYALHEALRDPLRQRAEPGSIEAAAERLHAYYFELVEALPAASPHIDAQINQIRAAFRAVNAADPASGALFADALTRVYEVRGLWADLAGVLENIVSRARKANDVFREHGVLDDLGYAQTVLGRMGAARTTFERGLTISRTLGDPYGEASALNNLGAIAERQGQLDEALDHYREALRLHERRGAREDIARALLNVAGVLYQQEQWGPALSTFQRALDIFTVQGDRRGEASTLLNIGAIYERIARDADAEQSYQRALAIYANVDDLAGQAQTLNNLGIIYFNAGENRRALDYFRQSLAVKEQLGDRYGQASTLNNIALLYERMGDTALALENFEHSHRLLAALDDPRASVVRQNIDALREQIARSI